jgi:hypothetical protein
MTATLLELAYLNSIKNMFLFEFFSRIGDKDNGNPKEPASDLTSLITTDAV